ncbi:ras-related protein Rab-7L1-like [Patiria miniata]|uniref:Ras-related protein Rab n=1 Tax=Patiria miniata TaxID=46514 RepID=A0A914AS11_PATMI|nr:ras-related protein Rab-7L1-like [Patiria miniata]
MHGLITALWLGLIIFIPGDFGLKKIRRSKAELVRLQMWDIAGQDTHRHLTRVFYRCASAAVVMFDLTSRASFDLVEKWKKDLDSKVTLADGSPIPSLLLGNKSDLQQCVVDDEEITWMTRNQNFVGWSKISVKDYLNIEEPMLFLVDEILARWKPTPVVLIKDGRRAGSHPTGIDTQEFSDSFELSQEQYEQKSNPCFCFF